MTVQESLHRSSICDLGVIMRFAQWVCLPLVLMPMLFAGPGPQGTKPKDKKDAPQKKAVPYGFKEYRIGMKFDDLEPVIGRYEGDELRQVGSFEDTIAGEECFVFLAFEDYGRGLQLYCIIVTAQKDAFGAITDALQAKYGRPSTARGITKKNAMGASFSGREFLWANAVSTLQAEEIGGKIDECRITWGARGLGNSKADKARRQRATSDI